MRPPANAAVTLVLLLFVPRVSSSSRLVPRPPSWPPVSSPVEFPQRFAGATKKRKSGEDSLVNLVVFLHGRGDTECLHGCVEMLVTNVEDFTNDGFVLTNAVT
jgi:hypothetical protein